MGELGKRMLQAVWAMILAGCAIGGRLLSWYGLQIERSWRTFVGSAGRRIGLVLVLLVTVLSGIFGNLADAGLGVMPTAQAHGALPPGTPGTPNRFDPSSRTTSVGHSQQSPGSATTTRTTPTSTINRGSASEFPKKLGSLTLTPGKAGHLVGSDGRLEVSVPADAITAADIAAVPGRSLTLRVSQVAPASGSNAGGSGHISFGIFLLQVVDGNGNLASQGLHTPVTLTLHYGPKGKPLGVDLSHAVVVLNTPLPLDADVAPMAPAQPSGSRPVAVDATGSAVSPRDVKLGLPGTVPARLDATQSTLTASVALASATTSAGYNSFSTVAAFGRPDPFVVDLNAGSLTSAYPIDVPAGPGGLMPPIKLDYSSAAVSEQHSAQAAAPWVGEGFNLYGRDFVVGASGVVGDMGEPVESERSLWHEHGVDPAQYHGLVVLRRHAQRLL